MKFGQSVWLDYIRRDLLTSGELKRLIEEDGLRGMTSNPAIFEKAIADSNLYDDLLKSFLAQDLDAHRPSSKILAIRDIQDAADSSARSIDSKGPRRLRQPRSFPSIWRATPREPLKKRGACGKQSRVPM